MTNVNSEAEALLARFLVPGERSVQPPLRLRAEFQKIGPTDPRAQPVLAAMLDMGNAEAVEEYRPLAEDGLFASGDLTLCAVWFDTCSLVITDGERLFHSSKAKSRDYWELRPSAF